MKRARGPTERRVWRRYLRSKLQRHALNRRFLRRLREGAGAEELEDLRTRISEARGACEALHELLDEIAMAQEECAA